MPRVVQQSNWQATSEAQMVTMRKEQETRKGPWTEQEDMQLVCFVRLFGERRWDFLAKVSGLNRTGKSCRLRWVNYLHPGLKRGRMTPQEERLILELHSQWGNRWSRIARKLPGRTDNEIKNYWRTHTRKMAQERKRDSPTPSSSSSSSSLSSLINEHPQETGVDDNVVKVSEELKVYPMDQIWKEIDITESMAYSMRDHSSEYLWKMDYM